MPDTAVQPMVSVVLTAYKHERYVEQAIRSAAEQQTDFPIEILVGEDASPDGTLAVCQRLQAEFPDRVQLFAHAVNTGGHPNVDFLWTRARGKYIAWLEGDDFWSDPRKLQIQVEAMERHPEASFSFHNTLVFTQGEPDNPGFLLPGYPEELLLPFANLVFSNRIMTCSVMYRRGLVPCLPEWIYALQIGDWPMHLMHAAQGPALFLPQAMAAYRLHPGGHWTSRPLLDRLKNSVEALDAVRLQMPPTLELLCGQSIAAFQREMELVRSQEEAARLQGELEARSAELHAANLALLQLQAEAGELHRRLTAPTEAAPPWRRAWRRVWRPIYRRLKGA